MAWRLAQSLIDLRTEINTKYPDRSKASDGTIGDTAHSSRKSDHNPDSSDVVRAMDITEWDPDTPGDPNDDVAEFIAETIRRNKPPWVKYVIWRERMFSSYVSNGIPAWTWRKYTGINGHFKHVHVSVNPDGLADEHVKWGIDRSSNTPTPPPAEEELTMDEAVEARFDKIEQDLADIKKGIMIDVAEGQDDAEERRPGYMERLIGSAVGWSKANALKNGVTKAEATAQDPTHKK